MTPNIPPHDNPLIEQFLALDTDAERAIWLRQCPDSILIRHFEQIRKLLIFLRFTGSLDYVSARMAALDAVKQRDGRLPFKVKIALVLADAAMGYHP